MADKTGYIGRNPNDSAVTVARQFFTASGVTTTFTFASGYLTGFLDVYVDGVKRRVADEFTATDGSTFDVLQGGVGAGSTVEAVAYKAFNAAAISGDVTGNFDVSGNTTLGGSLSVTGGTTFSNINVTGIATLGAGTTVAFANTAFNLGGTPDITIASLSAVDINVSGAATIGGILTYEDVTNIDSLGIVTARTGVEVTANGLVVNAGVSTFAADVSVADKIVHTGDANTAIRFPSADTITAETAGSERLRISSGGDVTLAGIATVFGATGIVSATSFDGDLTGDVTGNLTGTASNASGATGDFSIADKIVHTGDTNTAIRFPAADTFTVETGGSEALRVDSSQRLLVGDNSSTDNNALLHVSSDNAGGTGGSIVIRNGATNTAGNNAELLFKTSSGFTAGFNSGKIASVQPTSAEAADLVFYTYPSSAGTERLRIDSSGLVGIGTDNPDAFNPNADDLVIFGTGHQGLTIRSGTSHDGSIMFNDTNDANQRGIIRYLHTDDSMAFHTSGGEALRITSAGRVAVGGDVERTNYDNGSVSSNLLHVERVAATGNTALSICANAATTADVGAVLYMGRTKATSNGSTNVVADDDLIGRISFQGADGSQLVEAASIKVDVDGTPGANDMPGRIEFHTTSDGAASATERLRIDSSGRMLIGATSSAGSAILTVQGLAGNTTEQGILAIRRSSNNGNNAKIGVIEFSGGDNNQAAIIQAVGDNTWGTDDYPGRLEFYTTADGASTPTERLRITSGGNVSIPNDSGKFTAGTGNDLEIFHDGTHSRIKDVRDSGTLRLQADGFKLIDKDASETMISAVVDGAVELYHNGTKKFETTSSGITVTGTVSDSKGDLRKLIRNTQSGTYTLVAADSGKYIWASNTVTIPNNVFSHGDMVTIVNDTNGNLTLTNDLAVLYLSADGTTASSRTLGKYGMATLLFVSGTTAYISGAGLS